MGQVTGWWMVEPGFEPRCQLQSPGFTPSALMLLSEGPQLDNCEF